MDICSLPPDLISTMRKQIPMNFEGSAIDGPMTYTVCANPVIPFHIYQCWHDKKKMPKSVRKAVRILKAQNPEFEHHLYDERECRAFIAHHFPSKVVDAYDSLTAHAVKADLWRYCVMYKLGGVYLDSKYTGIHGFKFIYLTDKEYLCRDIRNTLGGVYNAIFICKPGNTKMLSCVNQLVENCKRQYYGSYNSCVGPMMVSRFFSADEYKRFELQHIYLSSNERYIVYKGHRILKFSEDYQEERKKTKRIHWSKYWENRTLYKRRSRSY